MGAPNLLLLPEALCLFNDHGELFGQLVVGLVGRQVEAVEAGVGAREPGLFAHSLHAEALGPVRPHKLGEPAHRDPARPAHELQQARTLLVFARPDELEIKARMAV